MHGWKYKLIIFAMTLILGFSLGYAWSTYHAYQRYVQYDRQLLANEGLIKDLEYRLKHCRVKYIWRCGKTSVEKKKIKGE